MGSFIHCLRSTSSYCSRADVTASSSTSEHIPSAMFLINSLRFPVSFSSYLISIWALSTFPATSVTNFLVLTFSKSIFYPISIYLMYNCSFNSLILYIYCCISFLWCACVTSILYRVCVMFPLDESSFNFLMSAVTVDKWSLFLSINLSRGSWDNFIYN